MKKYSMILLILATLLFLACESKNPGNDEPIFIETEIILSENELTIYEGVEMSIFASYESGNKCTPSWNSSDSKIVAITSVAEDESMCVFKALKVGTAQITAREETLAATCEILVLADSFFISTNELIMFPNCDTTLNAWYKSGKSVEILWSSSNENVVKISNYGKVSAVGVGTAIITATSESNVLECKVTVRELSGQAANHAWVDLGLSVRWATMNMDATSETDYGKWYCWGEIEPKTSFAWATYKWYDNNYTINWGEFYFYAITKYTLDDGWHRGRWYEEQTTTKVIDGVTTYETTYVFVGDNKKFLEPEDDVATVKWGSQWRMPSQAECQELVDNCRWVYGSINGVMGTKIIGPNGQFIFIPAAGCADPDGKYGVGSYATFWSNEIAYSTGNAFYVSCGKSTCECDKYYYRVGGRSVRPVCPFE